MFHIISTSSSFPSRDAFFSRRRKILLPLIYRPKKLQRLRRRRFALTKFRLLLTTTLAFFYKIKFPLIKGAKVKFLRIFKQLRFGNSQKKVFGRCHTQINLRHLEINSRSNSFTVLPLPYGYFYNFLLDQTFLWKSVLVELQLYYRK